MRVHLQPTKYKTKVPSDNEMIVFLATALPRELTIINNLLVGLSAGEIAKRKIIDSESARNKGRPVTCKTIRTLIKNFTGYSTSSIRLYGLIEAKKKVK